MRQEFESEVLVPAVTPSWRRLLVGSIAVVLVATVAGLAGGASAARAGKPETPTALAQAAAAQPGELFKVIIQGDDSERSDKLVKRVAGHLARQLGLRGKDKKQFFDGLRDQFDSIDAISVTLSGRELTKLMRKSGMTSITLDAPVQLAGNIAKWPDAVGARWYWGSSYSSGSAASMPTIAVVDSGIEAKHASDFGSRLLAQVDLATSLPNSPGDGFGHGTMVAGLAASGSSWDGGVAAAAKLVSIDVVDDNGRANTSDVIRACDWILANKGAYNIKVANFSLGADANSSFRFDPLDKAVEKLWFSGVTVVASAGNYGTAAGPSGIPLAPGNDPFVITVGASDINGTTFTGDDFAAPWSAYGYTNDGFLKPDIAAPGRYMIAPIPGLDSTLGATGGQDARLPPFGYLKLSGTSFAAPVVSGMVAALIAAHPDWTPDLIKGALMAGATSIASNTNRALGVGEANLKTAIQLALPPNPNAALQQFVVADPAGGSLPVFAEASWASAAAANASWASASWASASWASASWASASWASASWASASWASASWSSASWASTSLVNASWANGASSELTDPLPDDVPIDTVAAAVVTP